VGALAVVGVTAPSAFAERITTVVGTGTEGFSGDGGPATAAQLHGATAVAATPDGGFLVGDDHNFRIRKVSPNGIITTVAGTGVQGFSGDGGPATAAQLNLTERVAPTPDGGFLIADQGNARIRKVSATGIITTVAGTGIGGFSGDGGPATAAQLYFPGGVAPTPDGGFLLTDNGNHRVRRVAPNGVITTVAGNGTPDFSGDGGPATAAALHDPDDVLSMPDGGILISDTYNYRVRRVAPDGTISTVAGIGRRGFSGDGGPATAARITFPYGISLIPGGGFLIGDSYNHRIRKVSANGIISTVAGTGKAGFFGDGGAPTQARLFNVDGVSSTRDGGFLIADLGNTRIRKVGPGRPRATSNGRCHASSSGPRLGRTVVVRMVRGRISVKRPGQRRSQRLRGKRMIPVGSTIDASHGRVKLITATCRRHRTQSGVFYDGAFVVRQDPVTAVTDLALTGGGADRCRGQAAGGAHSAARRRPRRLWGNAHGRFRTVGRYSAAAVRGTLWLTEDACQQTSTQVRRGQTVVTATGDFPVEITLDPGERMSLYCTGSGPEAAPFYCISAFAPATPKNSFTLGLYAQIPDTTENFDLCLSGPDAGTCFTRNLVAIPDEPSLRGGKVVCRPRRAGIFSVTWRVGGQSLGRLDTPAVSGGGDNNCGPAVSE